MGMWCLWTHQPGPVEMGGWRFPRCFVILAMVWGPRRLAQALPSRR